MEKNNIPPHIRSLCISEVLKIAVKSTLRTNAGLLQMPNKWQLCSLLLSKQALLCEKRVSVFYSDFKGILTIVSKKLQGSISGLVCFALNRVPQS